MGSPNALVAQTLRLVLLVSCAHALVHAYELALPSVEQEVAGHYFPEAAAAQGKQAMGWLAAAWRIPWGFGAMLAGWLVDRYGARRMLLLYLLGCSGLCFLAGLAPPLQLMFVVMFAMGTLASIYHPAGLALISHATDEQDRPRALGIHGIFGSAGIALSPFLAGTLLEFGLRWQPYYWGLALPGIGVALLISRLGDDVERREHHVRQSQGRGDWTAFAILSLVNMLQGFVYSGVLSFLRRYLVGFSDAAHEVQASDSYAMAGILILGCIGQYVASRWARVGRLEWQLMLVCFANTPLLLAIAWAETYWQRILATSLFSAIHFMHQPLYNSLIATYTPAQRRSLGYGLSFALGLGVGGLGPVFVGYGQDQQTTYATLAAVTVVSGLTAAGLAWRRRASGTPAKTKGSS